MFNKVIMIGNLTKDVELRSFGNCSSLASISLASTRKYKKQDGTMGEEVCFVEVKLFGRLAEIAHQYLNKGSRVLIEGRLILESWVDQNTGAKRSKHLINAESLKLMDSKKDQEEAQTPAKQAPQRRIDPPAQAPVEEEEIPF